MKTDALAAVKSGIYSDSLEKEEYVTICQVEEQCYMGSSKVQNQKENQSLYIALRNKVTNKVRCCIYLNFIMLSLSIKESIE